MWKYLRVLILMVGACPVASAEIYKCVDKGGLDLYQNFPCSMDSIGSGPTAFPRDNAQPTVGDGNQDHRIRSRIDELEAQRAVRDVDDVPVVGMVADEVRAIWGQPTGDAIRGLVPVWHTTIENNPVEIWTYSSTRSVQFDQTGRVSALRN
jgi:hypothetical protein